MDHAITKDQALAILLDQLARAVQVIVSQHRIRRDEPTMRRIACELALAGGRCRPALQQER